MADASIDDPFSSESKAHKITDDGFDEDELRAAMDLSMKHEEASETADLSIPSESAVYKEPHVSNEPPAITVGSRSLDNIDAFRKIMFNDSITTKDDKERWIYECITTGGEVISSTSSTSNLAMTHLEMLTGCQNQPKSHDDDSKPSAVPDSMHKLWGLTQKHGGPCGVLAAIQAEMIRILLFGRDCSTSTLFYPFYATQDTRSATKPINAKEVKEAMAMAIGMILARASIMPSALVSEKEPAKRDSFSVNLVFPNADVQHSSEENSGDGHTTSAWISEMLNSNTKENGDIALSRPLGLEVHTVTCPQLSEIRSHIGSPANNDEEDDSSPESKRRKKKKEVTFATSAATDVFKNNHDVENLSPEEKQQQLQMSLLARGVASYLLGEATSSINSDSVKSTPLIPLDHFSGQGGIMFFVMSLVESRGIQTIKSGESIVRAYILLCAYLHFSSQTLLV
jgi:hypothetical protein